MKPFVLAISGGADSVYLLHQLLKEGKKPILAHLNHQVRGEKSDSDEAFLRELAKEHNLICEIERKNVKKWAKSHKKSLEEAGRILRYKFLEKVRKKHGADEILTAHHLNDNLETVLMNKLRGCHVRGRIGMRTKNNHIRRPLLHTPKSEILAYLKKHNLPYREDHTNQDTKHLRNWVRLEFIPQLLKTKPNLLQEFAKNRQTAIQTYEILKKEATEWFATHKTLPKNAPPSFPITDFLKLKPESQAFLLQHLYEETYGSTQNLKRAYIQEALTLIKNNQTGKQKALGPKLTLRTEYGQVGIEILPREKSVQTPPLAEIDPKKLPIAFDRIPRGILKTRTWQPGDRFQPSGMKGTKKLQDYFTDAKIPRHFRNQIPVFTTKSDQIVAVGERVDERFRKDYD